METETLNKDIKVFCITANPFPEGVKKAFDELNEYFPPNNSRRIFGLSRPENGHIIYKAAAEILDIKEEESYNLEIIHIRKGKYIMEWIHDYMKNMQKFGQIFQQLLTDPSIDHKGYCVEWYVDKDVKCMVRLEDASS